MNCRQLLAISALVLTSIASHALPNNTDNLRLRNQHDVPIAIPDNAKYLLYVQDIKGKYLLQEAFSQQETHILSKHNTYAVANVSGLPQVISRLFSYPSMRKLPYQLLLDEAGGYTKGWDYQAGKVTVFTLDHHKVTATTYIDSAEALRALVLGK